MRCDLSRCKQRSYKYERAPARESRRGRRSYKYERAPARELRRGQRSYRYRDSQSIRNNIDRSTAAMFLVRAPAEM